jgi:sec-independent protein translocase protein TatA
MFSDLFDSPLKILIIVVFFVVVFGYRKLPDAARSLGKSMRILKTEVRSLHDDDDEAETTTSSVQVAPAQVQVPAPVAATDAQTQIDALSKQLADLQQSVAVNTASPSNVSDSAQAK